MIEITESQIDRVYLILHNFKTAPVKVFYNALNRGLDKAATVTAREISNVYAVKTGAINGKIIKKAASSSNLTASLIYSGRAIPLINYDVTPPGPSGYKQRVMVRVLKSSAKKALDRSFNKKSAYGVHVRERVSKARYPLKTLYGPSLPQMAENTKVLEVAEKEAQVVINERIEQEIFRILNGYGG